MKFSIVNIGRIVLILLVGIGSSKYATSCSINTVKSIRTTVSNINGDDGQKASNHSKTVIIDKATGKYIKKYPNGAIREIGTFIEGMYRDSLKRFYMNGALEYESYYNENGNEEGQVVYYFSNGLIEFEYTAIDGKPVGHSVRFYPNGDEKEIMQYDENGHVLSRIIRAMTCPPQIFLTPVKSSQMVHLEKYKVKIQKNGYYKIYNSNNKVWKVGEFKSGRIWSGEVYEYDEDGVLSKVLVYDEGIQASDELNTSTKMP